VWCAHKDQSEGGCNEVFVLRIRVGVNQSLLDEDATKAVADEDEGSIWTLLTVKLGCAESQSNNEIECNDNS
jgi:hypothetical protein